MANKDDGGLPWQLPAPPHGDPVMQGSNGMSLRDAAALAALPSVVRACAPFECPPNETMEQMFARKAFLIADAFIARSKGEG